MQPTSKLKREKKDMFLGDEMRRKTKTFNDNREIEAFLTGLLRLTPMITRFLSYACLCGKVYRAWFSPDFRHRMFVLFAMKNSF